MAKNVHRENSRTKNSVLNMVTGVGGQLIMTICKFVARTVFIKVLGAEYLGIGGLFHSILSLLSLTELGLDTAINFKLYKPLAENDEKRVRILMKFYKQAYLVIGCVILVLGLSLIPGLPFLIKDYSKLDSLGINGPLVFILYLLQSVSSYLLFAYRTTIIKTAQKTYVLNVVDFFINIGTVVAQVLVLLFTEDFLLYLTCIIVLTLVKNTVNAVIAHRMFPYAFQKEKESITKEERNGIFKDCGALFVFKISSVVLKSTNALVISSIMGLAAVGLYSNYILVFQTLNTFINQYYSGVKASLGNVYAKQSREKSYFLFEVMNFSTILLNGTAAVGLAICLDDLIDLWLGPGYVIAQPLSIVIGVSLLFNGLKINLGQMRNISGAFRQAWKRPIVGCIINVAVSIIMCKKIGICGVFVGTITADVLANFMVDPSIIHKYTFDGLFPVSRYYIKNLTYFAILAAVGISDYFVCSLINTGSPLFNLIAEAIVCGVTVPVVFLAIYWKKDYCKYLVAKVTRGKLAKGSVNL